MQSQRWRGGRRGTAEAGVYTDYAAESDFGAHILAWSCVFVKICSDQRHFHGCSGQRRHHAEQTQFGSSQFAPHFFTSTLIDWRITMRPNQVNSYMDTLIFVGHVFWNLGSLHIQVRHYLINMHVIFSYSLSDSKCHFVNTLQSNVSTEGDLDIAFYSSISENTVNCR